MHLSGFARPALNADLKNHSACGLPMNFQGVIKILIASRAIIGFKGSSERKSRISDGFVIKLQQKPSYYLPR